MSRLPSIPRMYAALLQRDAAYEGVFIVGVKTTGIFCRPTCTARKPRLRNVEFFSTAREAMLAGYRACQRCRPLQASDAPAWVSSLLETVKRSPQRRLTAQDLRAMAIDPARASRYFKRHFGMTFPAFHRAQRMGMAFAALRADGNATRAGYVHGFASASGFRDAFARVFGTPPGARDAVNCLLAQWIDSPLGSLVAVADDEGLCLLEFADRPMLQTQIRTLRRRFTAAVVPGSNAHLEQLVRELGEYFRGSRSNFTVPLTLRGTDFQLRVWRELMRIPHGQTRSYAQLARKVGEPAAQRAVGRANGENRLAILVPCHRVVRSDGTLCGYGGGVWRKRWLLEHEAGHGALLQPRAPQTA